jgi:hypothetical protein
MGAELGFVLVGKTAQQWGVSTVVGKDSRKGIPTAARMAVYLAVQTVPNSGTRTVV